jgi:murein DD-endopeptidase MepM/ murein hydrolase activator NlpD
MDENTIGNFAKASLQTALSKKVEGLSEAAQSMDARERKKAAQEFASLLFLEVLKSMRAALPQDGMIEGESLSRDIYTSMMDGEIARVMAKRDSTGFARTVEKSLDKMTAPPQQKSELKALPGGVVSSVFGVRKDPINGEKRFHKGVDIAAPAGTPVKAAAAGKVVFSGRIAGYGNLVEVDHGNGLMTRYGHNSANLVSVGDEIQAGQAIALVGNTGRSTGNHLHFEVRKAGKAVNPEILLGEFAKGSKLSSLV